MAESGVKDCTIWETDTSFAALLRVTATIDAGLKPATHSQRPAMIAYLVLILAALSRLVPHALHGTGMNFTAVGAGLLFFGSRRPRWQAIAAVVLLGATDFYLTRFVYGSPVHAEALSDHLGLVCRRLPPRQRPPSQGNGAASRGGRAGFGYQLLPAQQFCSSGSAVECIRTVRQAWAPATLRPCRSTPTTLFRPVFSQRRSSGCPCWRRSSPKPHVPPITISRSRSTLSLGFFDRQPLSAAPVEHFADYVVHAATPVEDLAHDSAIKKSAPR